MYNIISAAEEKLANLPILKFYLDFISVHECQG